MGFEDIQQIQMEFNTKVEADKLASYTFAWLADANVLAKRPNASKDDLLAIDAQLVNVVMAISRKPDIQSSALRLAFGTLAHNLAVRIDAVKAVTDVLPKLVAFIEAPKNNRYNCMKYFSVTVLGHIAQIPLDRMRHIVRNLFIVLTEALKVCPSPASCPAGYRRDLLWALATSAKHASPSSLEYPHRRAVWKLARGMTADPAAIVAEAAFGLLEELAGPEMIKTKSKLEKLFAVYVKGLKSPHEIVRKAAAKFYARLFVLLETVEIEEESANASAPALKFKVNLKSALKIQGSLYQTAQSPGMADGVVDYFDHICTVRDPHQLLEEFSPLIQDLAGFLVQNVEGSDDFHLYRGVEHLRHLIVDVIAGKRLLNEQFRLNMVNAIIGILVKSTRSEQINAIGYVTCLQGLVELLGPAITSLSDPIHQTLIALMENTTEWSLAMAIIESFDSLTTQIPELILPVFTFALQKVTDRPSRSYGYLLAVLASKWTKFAKYVSVELNTKLLSTALTHIKEARAGHPVKDHTKLQVGWILLEGVLCLGPRIVKLHISQLLLLWKSVFAAPAKMSSNSMEVAYQLKARYLALSALAVFVARNGPLMTSDISRRLSEMLHGVWSFVDDIPEIVISNPDTQYEESLILSRLLQCYGLIAKYEVSEGYPASLLTRATHFVLDPEYTLSRCKDDCDVINDYSNNSARGVTSFAFEKNSPIIASMAFDAEQKLIGGKSLPLVTSTVDAAIDVISHVLPTQPTRVQESLLDRVRSYLEDYTRAPPPKKQPPARRQAACINASILLQRLTCTIQSFDDQRISSIVSDSIKLLLPAPESIVRQNAAAAYGSLASKTDANTVAAYTNEVIETLVSNTEPFARGGYALALSSLASNAASLVHATQWQSALITVTQLSSDPHPLVHSASVTAMTSVVANSGLLANKYAGECLAELTRLYLLDSHSSAVGPAVYSNYDIEHPITVAISRCCRVLVSLIGPDLAEQKTLLDKVYRLVDQFQYNRNPLVVVQSWGCFEELFYFAKAKIDWISQVLTWTSEISKPKSAETLNAALEALLLLFKTSPQNVFAITGTVLQYELWLVYDNGQSPLLRDLFLTWLEHTAIHEPEKWILRLQEVIMRPRFHFVQRVTESHLGPAGRRNSAQAAAAAAAAAETADEDQSLGAQSEQQDTELLSWKTRQFACEMMLQLTRLELKGKSQASLQNGIVTKNIRNVIKIAFSAATSAVLSMQLVGLELLNELVSGLSQLPDPDFPEVRLLEQYQAQISSALTPAFTAGSSPELAIAALRVCGTFVSSGIVSNATKLGRILRVMTDALESCTENEFSLGDLKLSPNAQDIIKVAVLRLWADVFVASETQSYLQDIVEPRESQLLQLWTSTIEEYAKLRFEPEQASSTSFAESLELMRAAQLRHVLMTTYEESWLNLVSALATLIESKGSEVMERSTGGEDIIFVLFGLCFEALLASRSNQLPILVALQRILLPGVSASVIYEQEIFTEVVDMLDRILLTGNPAERSCVIHIARNVATGRGESDESVDDLFELFRLCVLPLRALFPSLTDVPGHPPSVINEPEYLDLIKLSLDSLVDIVQVFREVIQNDLYVCLLYIFEKISEIPSTQEKVVPHIFSSYKRLLEVMDNAARGSEDSHKLVTDAVATAFVDASKELTSATDEVTKRNWMLTCMVILCTNYNLLDNATGNASQFGAFLVDALHDEVLAQVAAESMRACLAIRAESLARDAFISGCIPKLVEQLSDSSSPAVGKMVTKLVVQYAAIHPVKGMGLALTVVLYVINEASWMGTESSREVFVSGLLIRLLESHAAIFKQAIQQLTPQDRDLLRRLLVHDEQAADTSLKSESTIVLTSFS